MAEVTGLPSNYTGGASYVFLRPTLLIILCSKTKLILGFDALQKGP